MDGRQRTRALSLSSLVVAALAIAVSYAFSLGFLWALIFVLVWPLIGTIVIGDWSNASNGGKPRHRMFVGMACIEAVLFGIALSCPEAANFGIRTFFASI